MLPVGEVLPGVVVFLECGCLGRRGISPPDAAVLVIIDSHVQRRTRPQFVRSGPSPAHSRHRNHKGQRRLVRILGFDLPTPKRQIQCGHHQ